MFQVNGDNKFRLVQDGSAFYLDSQVNTYDLRVRLKDNNGDFLHNMFTYFLLMFTISCDVHKFLRIFDCVPGPEPV